MPKTRVLIEMRTTEHDSAFSAYEAAVDSESEAFRQAESLVQNLTGYGLEVEDNAPVPMFADWALADRDAGLPAFASTEESSDLPAASAVLYAWVPDSELDRLREREDVAVWPDSEMQFFELPVDCEPFSPAVPLGIIQNRLRVAGPWQAGARGQNIVVGILDSGVNGNIYPVTGGFSIVPSFPIGSAPITSHGSMCAADVLTAAPNAQIFDYPFVDLPSSGGALRMFQEVLAQRRRNGRPHITSNSYGFTFRPPRNLNPFHEVWDINHVLHRKVREVVASGATTFFAAGNCGGQCPFPICDPSSIGPERSIHASNSLAEVITVAAVNSQGQRLGYSAQGPGGFEQTKPDIAAYTHFLGNFGPGRPGGTDVLSFDNGTSAAAPLAAGVAALLLSAKPDLRPIDIKRLLINSASHPGSTGWNPNTGFGIIDAAAAFAQL